MLAIALLIATNGMAPAARCGLVRAPQASRVSSTQMLFNSDRSRRSAGVGDRKVTLTKPLGLELVNGPGNSVVVRASALWRSHAEGVLRKA